MKGRGWSVMLRRGIQTHDRRLLSPTSLHRAVFRRHVGANTSTGQPRPTRGAHLASIARSILSFSRPYIGIFLFYHIFTSYFYTFNPCTGISMLPTLNSYGDWLLISKYYRRGRGVVVGDLVSYYHPVDEGVEGVKRVAGLEGDFVLMDSPGTNGKMIQVPQGHCWIVGDNLKHSRDSRLFGPLPLALIKGKVTARYAPWSSLQVIKNGLSDVTDDGNVD